MRLSNDVFIIPVFNQILLYAPLHNFAALLNLASVSLLKQGLLTQEKTGLGPLDEIVQLLNLELSPPPIPKQGDFTPTFLGLLPTRACNLTCKYCAFQAKIRGPRVMAPELACRAIDWYVNLIDQSEEDQIEIHYFGGEPFCAEEIIDLTLHYARTLAIEQGYTTHFEVTTNGTFSECRCHWVADNFDVIVLSLDGPPDIHDDHRRRKDGRGISDIIARNAKILSEGPAQLCIRTCITQATVARMETFATWFCQMFRPEAVCFEPLQPTPEAIAAGLSPPDPWCFAINFIRASRILADYGVEAVYATANIQARQVTFCPVGRDVAIVSPDGTINACYLLDHAWQAKGLDMFLGRVKQNGVVSLDQKAVEAIRAFNVLNKPACEHCFCKWHCAGGCHVNNSLPDRPGTYNHLCIQTRLITLDHILKAMGAEVLTDRLLNSPEALQRIMQPPSDALWQDEIESEPEDEYEYAGY